MSLAITRRKGFHLKFANGLTVSVQYGPGNYCEHHSKMDWDAPRDAEQWESKDAEVALWDEKGTWLTKRAYAELHPGMTLSDDVIGYQSANDVARYITWAAAQPYRGDK